jgi:hypothetical protein
LEPQHLLLEIISDHGTDCEVREVPAGLGAGRESVGSRGRPEGQLVAAR